MMMSGMIGMDSFCNAAIKLERSNPIYAVVIDN